MANRDIEYFKQGYLLVENNQLFSNGRCVDGAIIRNEKCNCPEHKVNQFCQHLAAYKIIEWSSNELLDDNEVIDFADEQGIVPSKILPCSCSFGEVHAFCSSLGFYGVDSETQEILTGIPF